MTTTIPLDDRDLVASTGPGEPAALASIEAFLQTTLPPFFELLEPDLPKHRGRPKVLQSLHLWLAVLLNIARAKPGQREVWRTLLEWPSLVLRNFVLSDEAVYLRLNIPDTTILEAVFHHVYTVLEARIARLAPPVRPLAAFATAVVAIDQSTLDKMARKLAPLKGLRKGDPKLLAGKIAALFDVRTQLWRTIIRVDNAVENERRTAWALVEALARGTLVLADMGYFGFAWFDALTEQGLWWVSRYRGKTSYQVTHTFFARGETRDVLIWLGVHSTDRAKYAMRLVEFPVGDKLFQYLTNVLDPTILPLAEIARLYARRWDIEMAFNLIKTHLGLSELWSSKTNVIWQQIWGVLIVSQIVTALRWEIAVRSEVDPFDVSLSLLVKYASQAARRGEDVVEFFVRRGRELGYIRSSRRIAIQTPEILPEAIVPLPPGHPLTRIGRHSTPRDKPIVTHNE